MKEALLLILSGFAAVKASDVAAVDVVQYLKYRVYNTEFMCLNRTITGVSEKCAEQLDVICSNTTLLMTILDASSKFPYSGLAYSTRLDYGNFDQCMTLDHTYEGGRILGEHCTVGLVIPDLKNISDTDLFYKLSVCRPNGCKAADYNIILNQVIHINLPLFQDTMCHTKGSGPGITATDIVTIVIIAVVAFLMFLSTVYDLYLYTEQLKPIHPLFIAFSVISNGRKLLHVAKNSKEQIHTFHGLKVISIMWIIAGHGFVGWRTMSLSNAPVADAWQKQRYAGYIATAPLAVDTFFFISGFLLAYQYLKEKPKPLTAHLKSVPYMIFHRYLRLTPALFVIYMVMISIFKHLGKGPLWDTYSEALAATCRKQWWPFFLYIQNYYNHDDLCLTQTWYLSADMQMFIIAPLVVIPVALLLNKKIGFLLSMAELLIVNLFCTALPIITKLVYQDYHNDYDTHSRLINYFIGVMLAVFMRVKKDKPFLYAVDRTKVPIVNLLLWIVMILGMLTTVICYQEVEMNHGYESRSVFYSLMRPAWCTGLSWIVYSCHHGYGGIINWFLCRPIFQIWGRLTYCMYLLHGSIIGYYVLNVQTRSYFTDYNVFYAFCGHYIITLILSTFWTLAFESPLIIIEKYIFGGYKRTEERAPPRTNGNIEDGPKRDN